MDMDTERFTQPNQASREAQYVASKEVLFGSDNTSKLPVVQPGEQIRVTIKKTALRAKRYLTIVSPFIHGYIYHFDTAGQQLINDDHYQTIIPIAERGDAKHLKAESSRFIFWYTAKRTFGSKNVHEYHKNIDSAVRILKDVSESSLKQGAVIYDKLYVWLDDSNLESAGSRQVSIDLKCERKTTSPIEVIIRGNCLDNSDRARCQYSKAEENKPGDMPGFIVKADFSNHSTHRVTLPVVSASKPSPYFLGASRSSSTTTEETTQVWDTNRSGYDQLKKQIDLPRHLLGPVRVGFAENPIVHGKVPNTDDKQFQIGSAKVKVQIFGGVPAEISLKAVLSGNAIRQTVEYDLPSNSGTKDAFVSIPVELVDTGRDGTNKPIHGDIQLTLIGKGVVDPDPCTLSVIAQPPQLSLIATNGNELYWGEDGSGEDKLSLSPLKLTAKRNYTPKQPESGGTDNITSFKLYSPNLGECEPIQFDDHSNEKTIIIQTVGTPAVEGTTCLKWKNEARWRSDVRIEINPSKDSYKNCIISDERHYTVKEPLRLFLTEKVYGLWKKSSGKEVKYHNRHYLGDTINCSVGTNRAVDNNRSINFKLEIKAKNPNNQDEAYVLGEATGTLTAQDQGGNPITKPVNLAITLRQKETADFSFRAIDSAVPLEILIEDTEHSSTPTKLGFNHEILLTKDEKSRQHINLQPLPFVFFNARNAIVDGKPLATGSVKQDGKDSHFDLIARSQYICATLSAPLYQQEAKVEVINGKSETDTLIQGGTAHLITFAPGETTAKTGKPVKLQPIKKNLFFQDQFSPVRTVVFKESSHINCRIAKSNESLESNVSESQAHRQNAMLPTITLRIRMENPKSGRYFFGQPWALSAETTNPNATVADGYKPSVSPNDQIWITISRDLDVDNLDDLPQTIEPETFLRSAAFSDRVIPVYFEKGKKASLPVQLNGRPRDIETSVGLVVKPRHGTESKDFDIELLLARSTGSRANKDDIEALRSDQRNNDKKARYTKVENATKHLTISYRFAHFRPERDNEVEHSDIKQASPGIINHPISLNFSQPVGPHTYLRLKPIYANVCKLEAYYIRPQLGATEHVEPVSFLEYKNHSQVGFRIDVLNGNLLTTEDTSRIKAFYDHFDEFDVLEEESPHGPNNNQQIVDDDKKIALGINKLRKSYPFEIGASPSAVQFDSPPCSIWDKGGMHQTEKANTKQIVILNLMVMNPFGPGPDRCFDITSAIFPSSIDGISVGNHIATKLSEYVSAGSTDGESRVMASLNRQYDSSQNQSTISNICSVEYLPYSTDHHELCRYRVHIQYPDSPTGIAGTPNAAVSKFQVAVLVDRPSIPPKQSYRAKFEISLGQVQNSNLSLQVGSNSNAELTLNEPFRVGLGDVSNLGHDNNPFSWITPSQEHFADGDEAIITIGTDGNGTLNQTTFEVESEAFEETISMEIDGVKRSCQKSVKLRAPSTDTLEGKTHNVRIIDNHQGISVIDNKKIKNTIRVTRTRLAYIRDRVQLQELGPYRTGTLKKDTHTPTLEIKTDTPTLTIALTTPAGQGGASFILKSDKHIVFFSSAELPIPDHQGGDCSISDRSDTSTTVKINPGRSSATLTFVIIEKDDSYSTATIQLAASKPDGCCEVSDKALTVYYGKPKLQSVEQLTERGMALNHDTQLLFKLDNPAPREAKIKIPALTSGSPGSLHWHESEATFERGRKTAIARIKLGKDAPRQAPSATNGTNTVALGKLKLAEASNIKVGNIQLPDICAEVPELVKITSVTYMPPPPPNGASPVEAPIPIPQSASQSAQISLGEHAIGGRLVFKIARANTSNTTKAIHFIIRSSAMGTSVCQGIIDPDTVEATAEVILHVAGKASLFIRRPGDDSLNLVHGSPTLTVTAIATAQPTQLQQSCAGPGGQSGQPHPGNSRVLIPQLPEPGIKSCHLNEAHIHICHGDISSSDRQTKLDRTYIITNDPNRRGENILYCSDKQSPIIQVIAGSGDDPEKIKAGIKRRFINHQDSAVKPTPIEIDVRDMHIKTVIVDANPLIAVNGDDPRHVNSFCEDDFNQQNKTTYRHPLPVVLDRQMPSNDWREQNKFLEKAYDLTNLLYQKAHLDKVDAVQNTIKKIDDKITAAKAFISESLFTRSKNPSSRQIANPDEKVNEPPDANPVKPADYSITRRSKGNNQEWDWLVPAPNWHDIPYMSTKATPKTRLTSFPIHRSTQPWDTNQPASIDSIRSKLLSPPPHQYLVTLNACGRPDPTNPTPGGATKQLSVCIEAYPSDEHFFMLGMGKAADTGIHTVGANGTLFDPSKYEFGSAPIYMKENIKSVNMLSDPGIAPVIPTEYMYTPTLQAGDQPPLLSRATFLDLIEQQADFNDAIDTPTNHSISDQGSMLTTSDYYRELRCAADYQGDLKAVESAYVFHVYTDDALEKARQGAEKKKKSKADDQQQDNQTPNQPESESDQSGASHKPQAPNGIVGEVMGGGLWQSSEINGDTSTDMFKTSTTAPSYIPFVLTGRNGKLEVDDDDNEGHSTNNQPDDQKSSSNHEKGGASSIQKVVKVAGTILEKIGRISQGDEPLVQKPTLGWGMNVRLKVLQGKYQRYSGWKEADSYQVFEWTYNEIDATILSLEIELIFGAECLIAGVGMQALVYGKISGAVNATKKWETPPPLIEVDGKPIASVAPATDSLQVNCPFSFELGIKIKVGSEQGLSIHGAVQAKLNCRFDLGNDFNYSIYNGGVFATLEASLLGKKHFSKVTLVPPDVDGAATIGSSSDISMAGINRLLTAIENIILQGRLEIGSYLIGYDKLKLRMYARMNRSIDKDIIESKPPGLPSNSPDAKWESLKQKYEQFWEETCDTFMYETHQVSYRINVLRKDALCNRLRNRQQLLDSIVKDKFSPALNEFSNAEDKVSTIKSELDDLIEKCLDKEGIPIRQCHNRASDVFKRVKMAYSDTKPTAYEQLTHDDFETALIDLAYYADLRRRWR